MCSIADKAITLLEQHTVHLEMLIENRTSGLVKEKKNWENLLGEIFPRYYRLSLTLSCILLSWLFICHFLFFYFC